MSKEQQDAIRATAETSTQLVEIVTQLVVEKRAVEIAKCKQCLNLLHPMKNNAMRELSTIKDIDNAIDSKLPSIAIIKKNVGDDEVERYVQQWLIFMNESVNVKMALTPFQVKQTAFKIVSRYPSLNIADLKLIVDGAVSGLYGKLYSALSMEVILSWFEFYFNQKCEVAASRALHRHENFKYQGEKVGRIAQSTLANLRTAKKNEKK